MSYATKLIYVSIMFAAVPVWAQTDPHAGHHADEKTIVPANTDAAKNCPMMEPQAPAAKAQHQGAPSMQGAQGNGMMGGGMSPDMMKGCMSKPAAPSADHQHGN